MIQNEEKQPNLAPIVVVDGKGPNFETVLVSNILFVGSLLIFFPSFAPLQANTIQTNVATHIEIWTP